MIVGFFNMMGYPIVGKLMAFYRVVLIVFTIQYLFEKIDGIDILILSLIVLIIVTSIISGVDFENLYYGASTQLLLMFFFFVGRSKYAVDYSLYNRAIIVIIFVGVCGLFLYFLNPSWYLEMKIEKSGVSNPTTQGIAYEMMRLSAFWSYPYWISYGSAIVYCYFMIIGFRFGRLSLKIITILLFLMGILVLAQQRAPLLFSVLITLFFLIGGIGKRKYHPKFRFYIFLYIFILVVGVLVLMNLIDIEMLERLYSKMDEAASGADFFSARRELVSDVTSSPVSLFGDGLGSYSLHENRNNVYVITDQQYIKLLYENGIVGFLGYITVFIVCVLKGIRHLKDNLFELAIIMMYLIAMYGANCLCVEGQHPAIFWFCCGRLFNKECLLYKKRMVYPLEAYIKFRSNYDKIRL